MLQDKDITEKERRTAKIRAKTTNAARMKKIQILVQKWQEEKKKGMVERLEGQQSTQHCKDL